MAYSSGTTPSLDVPVLGYTSPLQKIDEPPTSDAPARLIVGFAGVTLDGKPFPWATVGDWIVTLAEDGIATLTVNIAISLPADPAASIE
jgi:hypothetical protein